MSREAQKIAAAEEKKLRERVYGIELEPTDEITLRAFFVQYLQNYTKKDIRRTKAVTQRVLGYFDSSVYLHTLRPTDCEEFTEAMKQDLQSESLRGYVQTFKKALQYAVNKGYLYKNPASGIVVKTAKDRLPKEVLSKDELNLLDAVPCGNEEVKRAFLFACRTGLGYAECKELRYDQIRIEGENHYLRYKRNKTGIEAKIKLGRSLDYIDRSAKGKGLVYPSLPSSNGANKVLQNWIDRAGIEKRITFYCARHTFGTLQAQNGVNTVTIKKNMGHSSTAHTEKYINFVQDAQDEAIDAID